MWLESMIILVQYMKISGESKIDESIYEEAFFITTESLNEKFR
jgi:hypothetical protein